MSVSRILGNGLGSPVRPFDETFSGESVVMKAFGLDERLRLRNPTPAQALVQDTLGMIQPMGKSASEYVQQEKQMGHEWDGKTPEEMKAEIDRLNAEIERLRGLVGAASTGESFEEIRARVASKPKDDPK